MLFIMLFASNDILVNDYLEIPLYFWFVKPSYTWNSNGERCLFYSSLEFIYSEHAYDPNIIVYRPHDTLFLKPFNTEGAMLYGYATTNPIQNSNANAVITEEGSIYEVFVFHDFGDYSGRDKFLITNIISNNGKLLKTFKRKIDFVIDFIDYPMIKVLTNNERFAWVYMDTKAFYWQAYDMQGDSLTKIISMAIAKNGYADACMLSDGSIIVGYYQQNDSCIYWIKYDTLGKQVVHPHSIQTRRGKGTKLHISILYPGTSALEEELLVTWIEDNHLYCRVFSKDLEPVGNMKELDNAEDVRENYALASFRGRETGVVWSNMEGRVYITTLDNNLNITGTKYLTENICDATIGCNEKEHTYDIVIIDKDNLFSMHSITTDKNGNTTTALHRMKSNATGYHQGVVRTSMNKDGKFAVVYREIKGWDHIDHQTYMYIFDREGNPLVEKKFIDSVGYFTNVYMRENDVTVGYHNGKGEITFKTYDLRGAELKETKVKYDKSIFRVKEIDFKVAGDTIDMFTEAWGMFLMSIMHKKILLGSKDDSLTSKNAIPLTSYSSTPSCQVRYLDRDKYLIAFTEENSSGKHLASLVYYVEDSIYNQVYVPTPAGWSGYIVGDIENNRVIGMSEKGGQFYNYAVFDTNFNLIMDTTLSYKGAVSNYGFAYLFAYEHTSDIIMHNDRAILLLTDFTLEHIRAKGLILNTETGKIIGELPIGADIDEPWYRTVVNKGSVAGNDSLFVVVWLDNRNNRGFDVYAHVYKWEDFEGIEEEKDISNTIVKLTGTDLFLNTDSYTIYDIQGRVVLKGNKKRVPLKTFSEGIYFVKYKNNNKEVVKKLVIVR